MYALKRNRSDGRSGKDRRRIISLQRLFYKGREKKINVNDRRHQEERRCDWVRIGKWSSVKMQNLKIAKYLLRN